MHEPHEAEALARRSPLQHLLIAIRIAECEDRLPSDEMVDAFGLARTVVDEQNLRHFDQHWFLVPRAILSDARGADDLLRRDAVGLVGEGAHELDAATRDDEGLEAVGAEIIK